MSNDLNAYLKAMDRVRDIQIDPNTGRVTAASKQSILEKTVGRPQAPVVVEQAQQIQQPQFQTPQPAVEENRWSPPPAKEAKMSSVQQAYMKSFMSGDRANDLREARERDAQLKKSLFVEVGKRSDEDDYMRRLAGRCNKTKSK